MKRLLTLLLAVLIAVSACTVAVSAANQDYPILKNVQATKDGLRVTWYGYENAAKYRVFYKTDNMTSWQKLGDTANLYYDHKIAATYTYYYYTVRAMDKNGKYISSYIKDGYSGIRYRNPNVTKIENIAGGVKVTVAPAETTTYERLRIGFLIFPDVYKIYVKGGSYGNSWTLVATTDKTTVSIPIARKNSGKQLTFTVRVANKSYFNAGKTITHIAAPTLKLSATKNGQQITVNKVAGASKYRVFIKENGKWKKLGDTTSSIVNKNVKYGSTYTYTVRALNASGSYISGYYNAGFTAAYLKTPKITKLAQDMGGLRLTWSAVSGADSYRIFYKDSYTTSWEYLDDVTGTSFIDYWCVPGEIYTYTVRCVDKNGNYVSYYDTVGKTLGYYGEPQPMYVTNSKSGVTLSWTAYDEIAKYRVFVKNGANWTIVGDTTEESYTYTNVQEGTEYCFTVRGMDKSGKYCTGYYTPGVYVTYYKNNQTTFDKDKLYNKLRSGLPMHTVSYGLLDREDAFYTVAVWTSFYGENCGDVTDYLAQMGQKEITDFLDEIASYGYDVESMCYQLEAVDADTMTIYFFAVAP